MPALRFAIDLVDTNHVSALVGGLGIAHGFLAPDK